MTTPVATRVALTVVVATTLAAVVAFGLALSDGAVDARRAGWFLLLFTALFAVRVAGQLAVVAWAPRWLPPMRDWHLMPYRLLLPIQLLFLVVMVWLLVSCFRRSGVAVEPVPELGVAVAAFSGVYAGAMVVRYVVRMRRRPAERWFGGAIPIVFHWVLASFLFVFGSYHASY
jgi:uncharacterized protein